MQLVPYIPKKKPQKRKKEVMQKYAHPFLKCRVVPFSTDAVGAKFPDSFSFPTSTVALKSSFSLSNSATTAFISTPFVSAALEVPTSITAGTISWGTPTRSSVGSYTALNNLATDYRPVGGGIRITTDSSLTTAAGHLWIVHVPMIWDDAYGGVVNWFTTEAQVAQFPLSEKYSMAELAEAPLVVPFRPISDLSSAWQSVQNDAVSNGGANRDRGWMGIGVYATFGTGVTVAINIEHIVHAEYLPIGSGGTYYGFGDAVPEPCNYEELQAGINLGQHTPTAYVETRDHDEETLFNMVVRKTAEVGAAIASTQAGSRLLNTLYNSGMKRASRAVTSFIGAQEEYKSIMY